MKKKILFGIALILGIGIAIYCYTYKEHRDIGTETANYKVTIAGLEREFRTNDSLATTKYLDKTIELISKISAIDVANKGALLDKKIFATFSDGLPQEIVIGKTLKIKGRFLGYDELLEEFKIDQCTIIY